MNTSVGMPCPPCVYTTAAINGLGLINVSVRVCTSCSGVHPDDAVENNVPAWQCGHCQHGQQTSHAFCSLCAMSRYDHVLSPKLAIKLHARSGISIDEFRKLSGYFCKGSVLGVRPSADTVAEGLMVLQMFRASHVSKYDLMAEEFVLKSMRRSVQDYRDHKRSIVTWLRKLNQAWTGSRNVDAKSLRARYTERIAQVLGDDAGKYTHAFKTASETLLARMSSRPDARPLETLFQIRTRLIEEKFFLPRKRHRAVKPTRQRPTAASDEARDPGTGSRVIHAPREFGVVPVGDFEDAVDLNDLLDDGIPEDIPEHVDAAPAESDGDNSDTDDGGVYAVPSSRPQPAPRPPVNMSVLIDEEEE